uniref:Putative secreted protein n=1 Tax=Anopheles triannulatus TaxID=58253 RepID=A0A2M4B7I3_9DIPT
MKIALLRRLRWSWCQGRKGRTLFLSLFFLSFPPSIAHRPCIHMQSCVLSAPSSTAGRTLETMTAVVHHQAQQLWRVASRRERMR